MRRALPCGILLFFLLAILGCGHRIPSIPRQLNGKCLSLSITSLFQVQSVSRRWLASDVYQYEVSLNTWDGRGYVPMTPTLAVVLRAGLNSKACFTNLKQGRKYRAEIVAKGNPGGTAPERTLNANNPCTVDFDLSGAQDVEDTLSLCAQVTLDSVPFSGCLRLFPQNVSSGIKQFGVQLKDGESGRILFSTSYSPNKAMVLSNLKAGVPYLVILSAKKSNGTVVGETRAPFSFDAMASQIEQNQNLSLVF